MTLHLVCDVSGSMGDSGKPFIMRTLVMAVAQWTRLGYGAAELMLSSWGAEVRGCADWNARMELPADLLACGGASDCEVLTRMLEEKRDDAFLLFTDALRIVKVGADANPRLKGEHVFTAENLLAALDGWPS
jgi:hypothetical protein